MYVTLYVFIKSVIYVQVRTYIMVACVCAGMYVHIHNIHTYVHTQM